MSEKKPITEHIQELLNADLDGELDAAGRDELRDLLAKHEEVRQADEKLKSVARLLEELPEVEPPPHLKTSIERQIRLPAQADGGTRKASILGSWLSANWLRTGVTVAAAAVLTIGVYQMGSESINDVDERDMVGTVIKSQPDDGGLLLDRVRISEATVSGHVELRKTGDLFTLDVRLNSPAATDLVVYFAGPGLDYVGFIPMKDGGDTVTVLDDSMKVSSTGRQHYGLKFQPAADTPLQQLGVLELNLFADGDLVHVAKLNVLHK